MFLLTRGFESEEEVDILKGFVGWLRVDDESYFRHRDDVEDTKDDEGLPAQS